MLKIELDFLLQRKNKKLKELRNYLMTQIKN